LKRDLERVALLIISIIFVIIFTMAIAGCGKKGDPTPKLQERRAAISDLQAETIGDGVLLRWSMTGEEKNRYVRIMRWETSGSAETCFRCPRDFAPLAKVAEHALREGGSPPGRYRYVDKTVIKGNSYGYRLIWGGAAGPESDESNTVNIFIKP